MLQGTEVKKHKTISVSTFNLSTFFWTVGRNRVLRGIPRIHWKNMQIPHSKPQIVLVSLWCIMYMICFAESGGRKINENKMLTSKKARYVFLLLVLWLNHRAHSVMKNVTEINLFFFIRFDPYGKSTFAICRICKSSVHQSGSHYCQGCAYKKGVCNKNMTNVSVLLNLIWNPFDCMFVSLLTY